MTKLDKISTFNPGNVGVKNGNLFGLPFTIEECEVQILPVPWDVTVSYSAGTHMGPEAILEASPQLDFYDTDFKDAWKVGFGLLPISEDWIKLNKKYRDLAHAYILALENGKSITHELSQNLSLVNEACAALADRVEERCLEVLANKKIIGFLGGDHSTPLGLYRALRKQFKNYGILHIDAHADLRNAYEGFTYSHASIFYNTIQENNCDKLVQVGIRDICEDEVIFAEKNKDRITIFYDSDIKNASYNGKNWDTMCNEIINELPQLVHISFDIDGLDPKLCPNTGTPVPGGFEFEQMNYLFRKLALSGKKIISFDLVEVAPGNNEWDANVGARLLWKLALYTALSNKINY